MKTFTVITIDNKTGKFGEFKVKAASMPKAKAVAKSIMCDDLSTARYRIFQGGYGWDSGWQEPVCISIGDALGCLHNEIAINPRSALVAT